jgi:hypothetical protein
MLDCGMEQEPGLRSAQKEQTAADRQMRPPFADGASTPSPSPGGRSRDAADVSRGPVFNYFPPRKTVYDQMAGVRGALLAPCEDARGRVGVGRLPQHRFDRFGLARREERVRHREGRRYHCGEPEHAGARARSSAALDSSARRLSPPSRMLVPATSAMDVREALMGAQRGARRDSPHLPSSRQRGRAARSGLISCGERLQPLPRARLADYAVKR